MERIRASMERRGIEIDGADIEALRRCEMTLHRWAELECGDGNDYQSWAIERDGGSGVPYMVYHPHNGTPTRRHKIADRETGALKRVAEICRRLGMKGCYVLRTCVQVFAGLYSSASARHWL